MTGALVATTTAPALTTCPPRVLMRAGAPPHISSAWVPVKMRPRSRVTARASPRRYLSGLNCACRGVSALLRRPVDGGPS